MTHVTDAAPSPVLALASESVNGVEGVKRKGKRSDPIEQSKKQRDNITTLTKTLITQQLRTDLGRSVGVTAVTQLVWLTGLRALNLPTNRNSRVIK